MIDHVCLWQFPECDFADWSLLVGSPAVDTYRGYLDLLTAVQADLERQGLQVVRVRLSVASVRSELEARGWENTPDNRAAIVGLLAIDPER